MSALADYQSGQTFPPIATAMLSSILVAAPAVNPALLTQVGGPPPLPHVMEALIDAIAALDRQING